MNYQNMQRETLGFFPTSLVELKKLSKKPDGPIFPMKRSDNTGLALGDNKNRKIGFILGDAFV